MTQKKLLTFMACLATNNTKIPDDFFDTINKDGADKFPIEGRGGLSYLTKRELLCLIYTAKGKIAKEIAVILNISPKTVESFIMVLKEKLGCYTRAQLTETLLNVLLKQAG